jgi:hypothetical protein
MCRTQYSSKRNTDLLGPTKPLKLAGYAFWKPFCKTIDIRSPRAILNAVQFYALRFQRSVKLLQLNKYYPRLMSVIPACV